MRIIGTYSRFGYNVEVFDDSGFLLESEEFGNVQYNSTLSVELDDPQALSEDVIFEFCERSCTEKSYLLGLGPAEIELRYDPV
jgi:hypothetical protein